MATHMAIDTEERRRSAAAMARAVGIPLPSGAVTAADRAIVGRVYAGIAMAEPPIPPAILTFMGYIAAAGPEA